MTTRSRGDDRERKQCSDPASHGADNRQSPSAPRPRRSATRRGLAGRKRNSRGACQPAYGNLRRPGHTRLRAAVQRHRREQSIGARGSVTRPVKAKPTRHDDQQSLPPVRERQLHAEEPRVRAWLIPKLSDRPQVVVAGNDGYSDREARAVCSGHRGNQLPLSRRHAGRLRGEEDLVSNEIIAGGVAVGVRDPARYDNQSDRQGQYGTRASDAVSDARPRACKPSGH